MNASEKLDVFATMLSELMFLEQSIELNVFALQNELAKVVREEHSSQTRPTVQEQVKQLILITEQCELLLSGFKRALVPWLSTTIRSSPF